MAQSLLWIYIDLTDEEKKKKQDIFLVVPTHGENSSLLPNTEVVPLPPSPPELTQIFIRLSVHCWH